MGGGDRQTASVPVSSHCVVWAFWRGKEASRYDADFQSWNALRITLYISSFKFLAQVRLVAPKRDEVTGEWRILHNEELKGLY